jgi:hypothetical protein
MYYWQRQVESLLQKQGVIYHYRTFLDDKDDPFGRINQEHKEEDIVLEG